MPLILPPFFQLHSLLDREGPGTAADVAWAVAIAGTRGRVRVMDAGCGPGADTLELARLLPEGSIEAVDKHAHFVGEAEARCAEFGTRVYIRQGDMADIVGPFDLIWCAGALYFLGVTEGLLLWRDELAEGGAVAFSEPVLVETAEGEAGHDFWADYPAITNRDGIADRVAAAGYRVLGVRRVVGQAWTDYYRPMEDKSARLRLDADDALTAVLDEAEAEIAAWRANPDHVAYDLFVVTPE